MRSQSLSVVVAALALLVFAHHSFVGFLERIAETVLALPASPFSWVLLGLALLAGVFTILHLTQFVARLLR